MSTGFIGITPSITLPDGDYQAKIERSGANQGFDDLSEHERAIDSSVLFILRSQHEFTVSNGIIEDTHGLLRPGDLLYNLSDSDTTDYGEGQRYFLSFTDPSSGNVTGPWGKEHWRI